MAVTFKDHSGDVLNAMQQAKSAALIKIGIAAKRNIQSEVLSYPLKVTGQLHDTIDYGADGQIGKTPTDKVDVGSPKDYAPHLEKGTSRMIARPFIDPGIKNNMDEYKDIAAEVLGEKMK